MPLYPYVSAPVINSKLLEKPRLTQVLREGDVVTKILDPQVLLVWEQARDLGWEGQRKQQSIVGRISVGRGRRNKNAMQGGKEERRAKRNQARAKEPAIHSGAQGTQKLSKEKPLGAW